MLLCHAHVPTYIGVTTQCVAVPCQRRGVCVFVYLFFFSYFFFFSLFKKGKGRCCCCFAPTILLVSASLFCVPPHPKPPATYFGQHSSTALQKGSAKTLGLSVLCPPFYLLMCGHGTNFASIRIFSFLFFLLFTSLPPFFDENLTFVCYQSRQIYIFTGGG